MPMGTMVAGPAPSRSNIGIEPVPRAVNPFGVQAMPVAAYVPHTMPQAQPLPNTPMRLGGQMQPGMAALHAMRRALPGQRMPAPQPRSVVDAAASLPAQAPYRFT